MGLKWIDSLDLALELLEAHPDVDPEQLHFPELYEWILALEASMMTLNAAARKFSKPCSNAGSRKSNPLWQKTDPGQIITITSQLY